jgi:hypothetical protein
MLDSASRRRPSTTNGSNARTVALMVGVLFVGLGFIFSYVGAFHDPQPHRVTVAVVAPAQQAPALATRLNRLPGAPLLATPAPRANVARGQVARGDTTAALIVNPNGSQDRLLIASGAGVALTAAVQQVITEVEAGQHRSVSTTDVVPLQAGDFRGLTGFYTVVGWLVAGYLLATLLAIIAQGRATTLRSISARLLALIPYSVAAGVGGMVLVDTVLGAQTGHFLALAGLGTLLVFAAAAVTIALGELIGVVGIGIAVLLFVVIGNPSAGGAYQLPLLPGFWRAIGNALPNGAGVDALRRIVYFNSDGITAHLLVIGAYCLGAVIAALTVTAYRSAHHHTGETGTA